MGSVFVYQGGAPCLMGHNVWIISAGDHCDHCDQDYSPGLAWTRPGPRSPLPRAASQGASYHVTCQSVSSGDGWRERAGGVVWDWMMTCWRFTTRQFGWSKCAWTGAQHSTATWWSPEYLIVWRHINDGPWTIYNTGTVLLWPGNHGLSVGKISIVSQNINHTIVIQPPTPALPQAAAGVTKLVQ